VIRLYVAGPLAEGAKVALRPDQVHYLRAVMRCGTGDDCLAFNGVDGEWRCRMAFEGRAAGALVAVASERAQTRGADLDLIISIVKRPRLETIVEKAAELGAARVRLAVTERSQPGRPNLARLSAIAAEAAEQTGRLDIPQVLPAATLAATLAGLGERPLMFCDEAGEAAPALAALGRAGGGAWAILIGPEGGFAPAERAAVRALPGALPVSLGPRILRADTAAIAALTLWQAALGDWRGP
jgi:16S rRNA (uracil1498-N3)-methyltransferase